MKELISTMIQEAVEGCSKYMADIIAVVLVANGVTILPEGAIILTRAEVEALGEYEKKCRMQNAGCRGNLCGD